MRKCPNCGKKTIKTFNNTYLSYKNTIDCQICNKSIGVSKRWTFIMNFAYIIFVIILFVLSVPIDKNMTQFMIILLSSGIVMLIIQLFIKPYEAR